MENNNIQSTHHSLRYVKTPSGDILVCDSSLDLNVSPAWFDADHWRNSGQLTGQAEGRGTTYFFDHNDHQYVLRHYRRGGLVGRILTDQFLYTGLTRTRAWRELSLLSQLQAWELPAPRPVAALVVHQGLHYRADLICERINQASDIHNVLTQEQLSQSVWREIGRTIRLFHDHQVFHHDLNIHNIMRDQSGKIWLIDFDKCGQRKGQSWKQQNLNRLQRSLHKEQARCSKYFYNDKNWSALTQGYLAS